MVVAAGGNEAGRIGNSIQFVARGNLSVVSSCWRSSACEIKQLYTISVKGGSPPTPFRYRLGSESVPGQFPAIGLVDSTVTPHVLKPSLRLIQQK